MKLLLLFYDDDLEDDDDDNDYNGRRMAACLGAIHKIRTLESEINVRRTFINSRSFSHPYDSYFGPYVY